jgi:hypothetical protein
MTVASPLCSVLPDVLSHPLAQKVRSVLPRSDLFSVFRQPSSHRQAKLGMRRVALVKRLSPSITLR